MHPRQRAANLATKQHGVITTQQALMCGMTAGEIRQELRSGRWVASAKGTYIVNGSARTWEQRVAAAVLTAGERAAASHLTAASLHGLIERRPSTVDVTVAYGGHRGAAQGFVIHRARTLEASDIRCMQGLRVTGPGRTLVDIAGVLDARRLGAALDRALLRGLVSIPGLRRYIDQRGLRRRRGVGRLVKLLDDREFGVPESELEREFIAVIAGSGLQQPVRQQPVGPYRVDFAYPDRRLLIELDGRATHGTAEAFEADPVRQNELVLDGWTVLRFTWKQMTEDPDYILATIRRALSHDRSRDPAP